jgi:hypothetical protein
MLAFRGCGLPQIQGSHRLVFWVVIMQIGEWVLKSVEIICGFPESVAKQGGYSFAAGSTRR